MLTSIASIRLTAIAMSEEPANEVGDQVDTSPAADGRYGWHFDVNDEYSCKSRRLLPLVDSKTQQERPDIAEYAAARRFRRHSTNRQVRF